MSPVRIVQFYNITNIDGELFLGDIDVGNECRHKFQARFVRDFGLVTVMESESRLGF